MVLVVVDAVLTVLHPDREGALARLVQRVTWSIAVRGGRTARSFAGPVMMSLTLVVWLSVFVVGHALVVFPFVEGAFRSDPGVDGRGFVDAVYYAGGTATVLGFGDIVPVAWPLQVLAVVYAGVGFALITSFVTYVVQLTTALTARVRFALRVADEAAGDGVGFVARLADASEPAALRAGLGAWSDGIRDVTDRLHRLSSVGLYYRSADPEQDPEPAIFVALDVARAAQILVADHRFAAVEPAVRSYRMACERLVTVLTRQYLSSSQQARLRDARPEDVDHETVDSIVGRLESSVDLQVSSADVLDDAVADAAQARTFAVALGRLAGS